MFLLALLGAAVIFLPFVMLDRGLFIYYGDFNVQQIPFYRLAHEAVRSGEIFWNWHTDLGVNFIGSYSFYMLFSPFFWLTLIFPSAFLPYLMAPLLILKTACAALTSFMYLRRFVRDERFAIAGGLLYAFSGWMTFNIFFNHFHEAAVFFPLLLWSLERLVHGEERVFGCFALIVALNAAVNYWFFIGEVVFVILYITVRTAYRSWPMGIVKFARIAFEAVLGVGIAAAALLPGMLALMGNPRTGVSELITGWNFWRYWDTQLFGAILHSVFFPPELAAKTNFFPDLAVKWASLSAWLPLLGPVGVMAYFSARKQDWLKTILAVCLLMALIPGLNSLFILLNHSYYARWFYMPVLLMSLASIRAAEDSQLDTSRFKTAIKWYVLIVAGFALMAGVTPHFTHDGELKLGLGGDAGMIWAWVGITLACIAGAWAIILRKRYMPGFTGRLTAGIMAAACGFGVFYIAAAKLTFERSQYIADDGSLTFKRANYVASAAIGGRGRISLPGDAWARSDIHDGMDNLLMYWGLPAIQAFHSIVPVSLMEFYPAAGVPRDVASRPGSDFYALRPLLSVRWLFIDRSKEDQQPMPGFTKHSEQMGFNVYENENWIPMGFAYNHYILPEQLDGVLQNRISNLMLRAVVLEPEAAERHADILMPLPEPRFYDLGSDALPHDVYDRREFSAYGFAPDKYGFTAYAYFPEEKLVFFSVPHEGGWSAAVNGREVQIEKANIGFMAVRVPAGGSVIRFNYMTTGLIWGLWISAASLLICLAYMFLRIRKRGPHQHVTRDEEKPESEIPEHELPESERTLRFVPPKTTPPQETTPPPAGGTPPQEGN
ncbi:MAG: YfhO family protein [Oscillospiraceae bacterium]|nr:YfhO family protein [Oscillospiraceae bacterium]